MIFRNEKGEIIKVFPYGSEEQQRFEQGIEILFELYQQYRKRKLEKKLRKGEIIESQVEECDKKIFRKYIKRSTKRYNMTQTAKILGVHRETLYYWIKKRWIRPRRDYRNYPVFTVLDIEKLIKWKNTIK